MQRNREITQRQWYESSLEMCLIDVCLQMDRESEDNLFQIGIVDSSGDYLMNMSSAHLEIFAKATNTRIVLLTFWEQTRHFTYLDIDWRTDELQMRYEDQLSFFPHFGAGSLG
jgi:hypothetical protein